MQTDRSKCADCGGCLTEVSLIDNSYYPRQAPVGYARIGARASFWTTKRPLAGTVQAFRCDSCGLLKLYGIPN